jgi:ABC-type nitrate/sulfonate/bicarbonate transport system permease component
VSGRTRRRVRAGGASLLVPALLLAVWWRTSATSRSVFYPPAAKVLASLRDPWLAHRMGTDLLPSVIRFTVGFTLAAALGIGLGLVIGVVPGLRRAAHPVIEMARATPPTLLLPIVVVALGVGNGAKVVVIAAGAVWPVLLNTVDGVRAVDPEALAMARSYRLGRRWRVTHVLLPGASPQIMVGLRVALAVGLILMVVSEMQGSTDGLGFRVLEAQRSFDSAGTYAGVIVIGLLGVIANAGFVAVERRILRWHRGARGLPSPDTTGATGATGRLRVRRPWPYVPPPTSPAPLASRPGGSP